MRTDQPRQGRHALLPAWPADQGSVTAPSQRGLLVLLIAVVALAVTATHWPALSAEARLFDDNEYLFDNQLVQNPSLDSVERFFTEILEPSTVRGYYQPLAMTSLMLDCAMGGSADNLRTFHRTNLCLHVLNTILVIVFLHLLYVAGGGSGSPVAPALAGLLFGLHPLTVESIPWVSERKTVLAACLVLASAIAFVLYVRRRSKRLYVASIVLYLLALLAKPTAMPLPAMLLLLDWWPLRRLSRRAVLEKAPFFAIGGVLAAIAFLSQSRPEGTLSSLGPAAPLLILGHNVVFYLSKAVWPANLSALYPFPEPFDLSNPTVLVGLIGTIALVVVLAVSLRWTRALAVGWLFFLVAIFPSLGVLTRFTHTIAADRHAYLPLVGLLLPLTWLLGWLWNRSMPVLGSGRPPSRPVVATRSGRPPSRPITLRWTQIVSLVVVIGLAVAEARATRSYLTNWRNTETLDRYMLSQAPTSPVLHWKLGDTLNDRERLEEAARSYARAVELEPDLYIAHDSLGTVLMRLDRVTEAIEHYRHTLRLKPDAAQTHNNLGNALVRSGQDAEAVRHYRRSLQLNPNNPNTHYNLALVLTGQDQIDTAIAELGETIRLSPRAAIAHFKLGTLLRQRGREAEAVTHFRRALQIDPNHREARRALEQ